MSMELIDRRKAISHITACDGKSAQIEALENMPTVKAIPLDRVEQILEKYKLRIPPTVYYDLLADVRNCEVSE